MQDLLQFAWLAPIVMLWGQIKAFAVRLSGVLVCVIRTDGGGVTQWGTLNHNVEEWLVKHGKYVSFGRKNFFFSAIRPTKDATYLEYLFERGEASSNLVFLVKGVPVIWNQAASTLIYLRFTFDACQMLQDIQDERQREASSQRVCGTGYRSNHVSGNAGKLMIEGGASANPSAGNSPSIDNFKSSAASLAIPYTIFHQWVHTRPPYLNPQVRHVNAEVRNREIHYFPPEAQPILHEVEAWLGNRSWFTKTELNCKRGYMLHGKPGCGKSSLVDAIARKYELPLTIYDLSSFDNDELRRKVTTHTDFGIILFEDMHAIFDGTKCLVDHDGRKLTFDGFLQLLSGVGCIKNQLVFMTTNYLERMDPALIRPGRADHVIEVKPLGLEGKTFIANRLLFQYPELIPQALADNPGDTPAGSFQNYCIQLVLGHFWNNVHPCEDDAVPYHEPMSAVPAGSL